MPHRFELIPMPASREKLSLLAVDRAVSELRRGRSVVVRGAGGDAALVEAAEAVTPDGLLEIEKISRSRPLLAITARRASVLGLTETDAAAVTIASPSSQGDWQAETVLRLADPLSNIDTDIKKYVAVDAGTYSCQTAAVGLAKLARLLPAAMVSEISDPEADDLDAWCARHGLLIVDAGDVFQYEHTAARTLKAVSEAQVPLLDAEDTRIVAFRPVDGGLEHLAIVIGEPDGKGPVLARLHSECFTGDLLGSLRCDCGDQLRGAISEIASSGGGVLLYLAQEGRGIGLVNKLRAYGLQDNGFDTMDANEQLGFDADERVYLPAAKMLRLLGYSAVRLMTNNPEKIKALAACGVDVIERVAHTFPANRHNEDYLKTKAARGGHLF
ncbi:MAG: GTP cyclohydrolase II [Alphaproteobacteria bacterium]